MRGPDERRSDETFTASPESLVPTEHPLRPIKAMADAALADLSPVFDAAYALYGRPSIPPERLLRALLLQILYSVRSERMLVEQLQYNMLFRWFVGMSGTEPVWNPTTYTKNRERFLEGDVAVAFFNQVLDQARAKGLVSDEHFSVDGTLVEAWASFKSLKAKDGSDDHRHRGADGGHPTRLRRRRPQPAHHARRRQGLRHGGVRRSLPGPQRHAARRAERHQAGERDRWAHGAARGLRGQPQEAHADRGDLRLVQDGGAVPQDPPQGRAARGLDVHVHGRGVQHGAHANHPGRGVSRGWEKHAWTPREEPRPSPSLMFG